LKISNHVQIASLLTALRIKGETIDEITAAAKIMREKVTTISITPSNDTLLLDTCGTGGDQKSTFNISTVAAFVIAGAGVKIAKHGNRSVTSKCGSADLMEALGVNLNVPVKKTEECINLVNLGFLFAPLFHSAMKHVAPVRKELGINTTFTHNNCALRYVLHQLKRCFDGHIKIGEVAVVYTNN